MSTRWHWSLLQPYSRADRAIVEAMTHRLGQWDGPEVPEAPPSRSQIQKWIEEGRARLNSHAFRSQTALKAGDLIEIDLPEPTPMTLVPEDRPLEILFEDQHLLVVNKPQGLTVHPSSTQATGTLVHALLHHIKDLSGIGGVSRPGIVHRLDKDTSGVLVVSKSDPSHLALSKTFAAHEIERTYWALVYGVPKHERDQAIRVESLIGRNPQDRKKMSMKVTQGRQAISHISTVETYSKYAAWVSIKIDTGRTHQIRVHLTGLGHSILGDPVYGVPTSKNAKWQALPTSVRDLISALPGQALHARSLGFNHPITQNWMQFEAEPPRAWIDLREELRSPTTPRSNR